MDVARIKKDFPIFRHHPDLVYMDSTATTLKPECVIAKITEYYECYSANVARGVYRIAEQATTEFEETRSVVAQFIGAQSEEVIFTSGTTASLNLVAHAWGSANIREGDGIVVSAMDHHANFVTWQQLAKMRGATFSVITLTKDGKIDLTDLEKKITPRTKLLALPLVSNVLGTIVDVAAIAHYAKQKNPALVIVGDAAQAAPHDVLDVRALGCDFLAFSAHKMCGPTGVGVLWGKKSLLEAMSPMTFGGEMIQSVSSHNTTFADVPHKFEAGTPHIAGVIAFKEAIRYIQNIGLANIRKHEERLTAYALDRLAKTFGERLTIFGPRNAAERCGLVSFTFHPYHPHDIAHILDAEKNVCVRAGHHCAMPLHTEVLCVSATTRASFYIYNDLADVDALVEGLQRVDAILGR